MSQPLASDPMPSMPSTPAAGRPVLKNPYPPHPTSTRPYRPGLAERLYLPLSGLMVTMRHFLKTSSGPNVTPSSTPRSGATTATGSAATTSLPPADGSVRCVACFLCAQPPGRVHPDRGRRAPGRQHREVSGGLRIDMLAASYAATA